MINMTSVLYSEDLNLQDDRSYRNDDSGSEVFRNIPKNSSIFRVYLAGSACNSRNQQQYGALPLRISVHRLCCIREGRCSSLSEHAGTFTLHCVASSQKKPQLPTLPHTYVIHVSDSFACEAIFFAKFNSSRLLLLNLGSACHPLLDWRQLRFDSVRCRSASCR